MSVSPLTVQRPSIDDYFTQETTSEHRYEYRDGLITEMTGGTPEHNELSGSLVVLLRLALKGKPYQVFATDQRLWIPEKNLYTYPDLMVMPKPISRQEGRSDTVINPIFIAEVLSKSTRSYDRDEKFEAYRTIPTFQDYLLIDQYRIHLEHYVKQQDHQWLFTEYDDPAAQVHLTSLPIVIPVAELYAGIEF
ncbi:Uma2 family endonuclease [Spirulina major]|uniref:Uma2 family endonuclease n=1 Tax=Spirulina major TaxID=270636 RepID=UPI00093479F8|nr:Uma2 family endonuclease [Spirulina major]